MPARTVTGVTVHDSNLTGIIPGFVVGASVGAYLGEVMAGLDESSDGSQATMLLTALAVGAGGAGIGYALDNSITRVVYKIPVTSRVFLRPAVGLDTQPGRPSTGVRAALAATIQW